MGMHGTPRMTRPTTLRATSRATLLPLIAALAAVSAPDRAAGQEPLRAVSVETLTSEIEGGSGGISVDRDGNVYVADFGTRLGRDGTPGTKVFRVSPDGTVEVFATGLRGASGNEFDSRGYLFQSNVAAGTISRIAPDGKVTEFADGQAGPVGIVSDADDNLYVTNCGNGSIQKVTPDGEASRFAADSLLRCPNGIVRDDDGNLYTSNFYNGDVIRIAPDGSASRLATLPGGNNGHLLYHGGFLYVVDRGGHQIWSVSLDGEIEPFAGSGARGLDDGDPMEATFSFPNDIGISPDGTTFYVNDVVGTGPHDVLAPMIVRAIRVAE